MTEREELIEKVGRRLFGSTVDSMGRARELARLALDLFEQSHTPTNDEREVLTRIVHDETGEPEEESSFVADAIQAAGFRRPVQVELEWEYVPGEFWDDGVARVSSGTIAPGYVAQFMSEGGEVVRRRVGRFETVTADMLPVPDTTKEAGE